MRNPVAVAWPLSAFLLFAALGCAGRGQPMSTADQDVTSCDSSRIRQLNSMSDAVTAAQAILLDCPSVEEEVLLDLLEVGKKNPRVENRRAIIDLYDGLSENELVNVRDVNILLTRYFYTRFASIDGVQQRFSSLSDDSLDRLVAAIDNELKDKKIGFVDVSGLQESYEEAEQYGIRMIDMLDSMKIQWNHMQAAAHGG